MTHRDKNGKSMKSLGQDPFADLDASDFEAVELETQPSSLGDERQPLADKEPPAETAFTETTQAVSEIVAEPDEESGHLLDDLIAKIDDEIERTLKGNLSTTFVESRKEQQAKQEAQYVIFRLAGVEYAASALNIKEVGELTNLTPVPNVPHWLQGVTNLRGDILSVVDLRLFLNLNILDSDETLEREDALFGLEQEILIAHPQKDASLLTTGFIVDTVSDIDYLPLDKIIPPTSVMNHQLTTYIKGVYDEAGRMIIVLDFDKLLLSPEMRQFEAV